MGFYPSGQRSFEEIETPARRQGRGGHQISAKAEVDFFRVLPPRAGYTKGLPASARGDHGEGDIAPENPRPGLLPLQALSPRRHAGRRFAGAGGQSDPADPGFRRIRRRDLEPKAARPSRRRSTGSTCWWTPRPQSAGSRRSGCMARSAMTGRGTSWTASTISRPASGRCRGPRPRRRGADPGAAGLQRASRAEIRRAPRAAMWRPAVTAVCWARPVMTAVRCFITSRRRCIPSSPK